MWGSVEIIRVLNAIWDVKVVVAQGLRRSVRFVTFQSQSFGVSKRIHLVSSSGCRSGFFTVHDDRQKFEVSFWIFATARAEQEFKFS